MNKKEQIIKDYDRLTLIEISQKYDVSIGVLRKLFDMWGVPLKSRGSSNMPDRDFLIALLKTYKTIQKVASVQGVSSYMISKWCRTLHVPYKGQKNPSIEDWDKFLQE